MKVGDTFYNIINGKKYKCHVVSTLNREVPVQIVYKYFGKNMQWWHYKVDSYETLRTMIEIVKDREDKYE